MAIDSETAGATTAHFQQNNFLASVRVDYDEKQATIRHMASKNFNYETSPTGRNTFTTQ